MPSQTCFNGKFGTSWKPFSKLNQFVGILCGIVNLSIVTHAEDIGLVVGVVCSYRVWGYWSSLGSAQVFPESNDMVMNQELTAGGLGTGYLEVGEGWCK